MTYSVFGGTLNPTLLLLICFSLVSCCTLIKLLQHSVTQVVFDVVQLHRVLVTRESISVKLSDSVAAAAAANVC